MGQIINIKDYQTIKMRGNDYLPVHQQVKAAIDHGILLGSSTQVEETDTHIRVTVTIRVLNKHIENWHELPENLAVGFYDGVAETIKGKPGNSAEATFPIETTETSALGRALAKIGISVNGMATADEMELIDRKQATGSGYTQNTVPKEKIAELYAALKKSGVASKEEGDAAAKEMFGVSIRSLTTDQINEWVGKLNVPF